MRFYLFSSIRTSIQLYLFYQHQDHHTVVLILQHLDHHTVVHILQQRVECITPFHISDIRLKKIINYALTRLIDAFFDLFSSIRTIISDHQEVKRKSSHHPVFRQEIPSVVSNNHDYLSPGGRDYSGQSSCRRWSTRGEFWLKTSGRHSVYRAEVRAVMFIDENEGASKLWGC